MSDNLGITRLPQGAETPEVMINAALSEIDAFLSDSVEVDLSAANANLSLAVIKAGNFISLNGAAEARTVLLPQTKRTLFLKNYGTAEVTVARGTKSVAIPAGQARTVRLTGATDGLEDIGGGGSGGSGGGLPEAPTDGKFYARKSAAWAEVPAAGGSPGVTPNFKIWRLYGTIKPTTNQIGFDTFNINNAVDGTVTVAVSSTESSYPAGNAKPGVAGAWYSAPGSDPNPWIEYTFPAPIDGHSIYLYNNNATFAPQSIRLEARNSTSDPWTVVIPTTPHTPTVPGGDASYGIPRIVESGGGGIEEAPTDGKQYARKNAGWTEVVATGGGSSGDPFVQYIPLFKIWRFTCTRSRDTNRFAIAELVMADIDGNSLNSRVIASSSKNADGTNVVANVLDGNNATVYMSAANASAADPQWIEFEFDTPVSVAEFRMKVQASWWERFPYQGWISGRNAAADPHTITTTYDIGRASPQQQETFFAFQTVKRILHVVGPYPIEPPTATTLPLEFKSGAGVVATLVDNPRGFLMRRTDTGSSGSDTNYERMRTINPANDYILDCIIKAPPTNRTSSYTRYGLALRESATDKHLYYYFATENGSPQIARLYASNIQGAGAGFSNIKSYSYSDCYFRIVKTSAGYQLQFSENYGITFTTLETIPLNQYFTTQADQVGLIAQAYGGFTAPMDLVCPYFKFIQV